jgi:hypothetical protein
MRGGTIVTGNVIADLQLEMKEIKRRLKIVEADLERLRQGRRGEQPRDMIPRGGVS